MIRQCIVSTCRRVFGCLGYDGKKWECTTCSEQEYCFTYLLQDPPLSDVTGGLCPPCFEEIMKNRKKR